MTTDQPCPFCHSLDSRRVDESFYRDDDDHGDHVIVECNNCRATAPTQVWNRDPWRYPPDMPEEGQRVLHTYKADGNESRPVVSTYTKASQERLHPIVRWMPIPEVER